MLYKSDRHLPAFLNLPDPQVVNRAVGRAGAAAKVALDQLPKKSLQPREMGPRAAWLRATPCPPSSTFLYCSEIILIQIHHIFSYVCV